MENSSEVELQEEASRRLQVRRLTTAGSLGGKGSYTLSCGPSLVLLHLACYISRARGSRVKLERRKQELNIH